MRTHVAQGMVLVGIMGVLGACGGGGGGGGGNNPATTLAMATPSGNAQTDSIGAPLTNQLRVEVKEDGALKDGATVTWSVSSGGGMVSSDQQRHRSRTEWPPPPGPSAMCSERSRRAPRWSMPGARR